MFAYSSVGQVGYITLGLALATRTGLTGGLVHIVNHALTKGAIFMGLGAVVFRTGRIGIDELAGIGRRMPATMTAVTIAGFSLVGVPGTAGFVSKWYLILASFELGWWWLAFLVVASSLLTLVYVGRVVEAVWFREPARGLAGVGDVDGEMLVPVWLLAGATVLFGLDAETTAGVAARAADALLGGLR
jgi:multicomponent Na+:H+ antiporter subunit D